MRAFAAQPHDAAIAGDLHPTINALPRDIRLFNGDIDTASDFLCTAVLHFKIDTLPIHLTIQGSQCTLIRVNPPSQATEVAARGLLCLRDLQVLLRTFLSQAGKLFPHSIKLTLKPARFCTEPCGLFTMFLLDGFNSTDSALHRLQVLSNFGFDLLSHRPGFISHGSQVGTDGLFDFRHSIRETDPVIRPLADLVFGGSHSDADTINGGLQRRHLAEQALMIFERRDSVPRQAGKTGH